NTYFENVLGVSKMPNQKPQMIVMKIIKEHAPYIITKPVHPSQKILREDPDGTIFSIEVIWNFELEREILGFGEQVIVLSPRRLSGKIQARMKHTLSKYSKKEKSN
ncbi:MAG TPA: WYL domain-containing protein, partial [Bacteroidia bacterium]|nr:WYL domain-containing protein [Bacteroidia bacterium]